MAGGSCPHRAAKLAVTYDVPASRESTATSSQDAARIFAGFADRYTDRCRVLAETRHVPWMSPPLVHVARCGAHEAFAECLSGRLNSKLIRASDGDRVAAASA